MNKVFLTTLIVLLGLPMYSQDISFPSAIVAAGGSSEGGSITLSRWRLAPVHVITLTESKINEIDYDNKVDWEVILYPNPVADLLNVEFKLAEEKELLLKITDVSGRVLYIQEPRTFIDRSSIDLDFSRYIPALYLLQITSPDVSSQRVYRIQKL